MLPDVRGRDRLLALVQGRVRPAGPLRGQLVNGLRFDFDGCEDGSLTDLIGLQYRRPALAHVVEHFARLSGCVIYDIGANIGLYSLWAAHNIRGDGEVHAFEPVPETVVLLNRFLAANPTLAVQVVTTAVGRAVGRVTLFTVPGASGLTSGTGREGSVRRTAPATTIDRYSRAHAPPTFVKIDVEGYEADVPAGAAYTLRVHSPASVLEVFPEDGSSQGSQPLAMLRDLGYEVFDLRRRGLHIARWPTTPNVLALHPGQPSHRAAYAALKGVRHARNQMA